MTAAVEQRNSYKATDQTLLGDGAAWIWALGANVLGEATPVLDRWHLGDTRGRAIRRALPAEPERAGWTERIERCLAQGDVPGVRAALAELAATVEAPAIPKFSAFLAAQAPRIPDYAERRAAGQPVGSGGVEKGVDIVVNRRCKGRRRMRWWRARSDEVLALRVAKLNGEWEQRLPLALTPTR